ncbi:MAG: hypothetical protein Q8L47_05330 [bacterium]|nr:hypothetical protein [bacterium]
MKGDVKMSDPKEEADMEEVEEKIREKEIVYQNVVEAINLAKKALIETGVCNLLVGKVQSSSEVAITIVAAIMYSEFALINSGRK